VLGDSITFGLGVIDGAPFPEQLEKRLRADGTDCSVFNLAAIGYDSYQERVTLEKHVDRIDPHMVVVCWYRNDVYANTTLKDFRKPKVIDGYLIYNEKAYDEFRNRIDYGTWRQSAFLRYLSVQWKLLKKRRKFWQRVDEMQLYNQEGLPTSMEEVNKIQEICLERGMKFIFIAYPNMEELYREDLTAINMKSLRDGTEKERYRDITTFVPLPELWYDSKEDPVYLPGDRCHPSALGHERIAEILYELPVIREAAAAVKN
jgi:lysophospholipase L1-like esterase